MSEHESLCVYEERVGRERETSSYQSVMGVHSFAQISVAHTSFCAYSLSRSFLLYIHTHVSVVGVTLMPTTVLSTTVSTYTYTYTYVHTCMYNANAGKKRIFYLKINTATSTATATPTQGTKGIV